MAAYERSAISRVSSGVEGANVRRRALADAGEKEAGALGSAASLGLPLAAEASVKAAAAAAAA
jgi:hypothetical protein